MKILSAATVLLSISMLPTLVCAENTQNNPSGPYVGMGYGQFNLNIRNLNDVGAASSSVVKSDNDAWKVFGGWRLNPYFAFEAAYIDFGQSGDRFSATGSNGNYNVDLSGFAPSVIGSIPIGAFELFAKFGSYFYDVKTKVNFDGTNQGLESTHSRKDWLYGGGLGFVVADHLTLRAEYETIDLENAENSDAFWLTAAWRF